MEKNLLQVLAFQRAVKSPEPPIPTMLGKERAELRRRLLQEEVDELTSAENINDVSDAIIDILYIVFGTAHEYGLADRLPLLFDEVHRSNMTKLDENGNPTYREDGKVVKPKWYSPPNFTEILKKDFTALKSKTKDLGRLYDQINREEYDEFMLKVDENILDRLEGVDKSNFHIMKRCEKSLKDVIDIDIKSNDMVTGRVALITIYDKTETVEYQGY